MLYMQINSKCFLPEDGMDSDEDMEADDGDWTQGPTSNSVTTREGVTVSVFTGPIEAEQVNNPALSYSGQSFFIFE